MGVERPRELEPVAATIMALLGLFSSMLVVAGHQRLSGFVLPAVMAEVALIALAVFQWYVFVTRLIAFEVERRINALRIAMEARREPDHAATAPAADASSPSAK